MIGYALATALAAPVDDGMMLADAARPARQSPFMLPSTVRCEAVAACTVVMRPCLMPNFSLITFTSGEAVSRERRARDHVHARLVVVRVHAHDNRRGLG